MRLRHIGGPTVLIEHFRPGRDAIERELARSPDDVRSRFRWLPIGTEIELGD